MNMAELIGQARFRARVKDIAFVWDDPLAERIVGAWEKVPKTFRDPNGDFESLREAWKSVDFDLQEWRIAAGVHVFSDWERAVWCFIYNDIIYPDGSVNPFVDKYFERASAARFRQAERGGKKKPKIAKPPKPVKYKLVRDPQARWDDKARREQTEYDEQVFELEQGRKRIEKIHQVDETGFLDSGEAKALKAEILRIEKNAGELVAKVETKAEDKRKKIRGKIEAERKRDEEFEAKNRAVMADPIYRQAVEDARAHGDKDSPSYIVETLFHEDLDGPRRIGLLLPKNHPLYPQLPKDKAGDDYLNIRWGVYHERRKAGDTDAKAFVAALDAAPGLDREALTDHFFTHFAPADQRPPRRAAAASKDDNGSTLDDKRPSSPALPASRKANEPSAADKHVHVWEQIRRNRLAMAAAERRRRNLKGSP